MFGQLVCRFVVRFLLCALVAAMLLGVSGRATAGIFRNGKRAGCGGNVCSSDPVSAAPAQRPGLVGRLLGRGKLAATSSPVAAAASSAPACSNGKCNPK